MTPTRRWEVEVWVFASMKDVDIWSRTDPLPCPIQRYLAVEAVASSPLPTVSKLRWPVFSLNANPRNAFGYRRLDALRFSPFAIQTLAEMAADGRIEASYSGDLLRRLLEYARSADEVTDLDGLPYRLPVP